MPLDLTHIWTTFPVLQTERCILRGADMADADAMFRIFSDAEAMRYFGSPPITERSQAVERVQRRIEHFAAQQGIRWSIMWRETNDYLGSCGYWRIDSRHHRAELGYELDPAWWGRGIMTEVLNAIIAYGFKTMQLHSIEAQIHPDNQASRRVLEKNGFVQEGYFRESYYDDYEHTFTDNAIFSLLRRDWQAAKVKS